MSLGMYPSLVYSSTSRNLHRGPETHSQAARISSYIIAIIVYMAHFMYQVQFKALHLFIHSHNY